MSARMRRQVFSPTESVSVLVSIALYDLAILPRRSAGDKSCETKNIIGNGNRILICLTPGARVGPPGAPEWERGLQGGSHARHHPPRPGRRRRRRADARTLHRRRAGEEEAALLRRLHGN